MFLCFVFLGSAYFQAQTKKELRWAEKALLRLGDDWYHLLEIDQKVGKIRLDSLNINREKETIQLRFNKTFSYLPIRESFINQSVNIIKSKLRHRFRDFDIQLMIGNNDLKTYIPNIYRIETPVDSLRFSLEEDEKPAFVKHLDQQLFKSGLSGCNIALWGSHGKYYEMTKDRWEWQRSRFFGTVEDLLPTSFILNFLTPMLENSGAYVMMPRERDIQNNEVIVDNDYSTGDSQFKIFGFEKTSTAGFIWRDTLYANENPFDLGRSLILKNIEKKNQVQYIPDIPESGSYAVYVSYRSLPDMTDDAEYQVFYKGGTTNFRVNQTIGGGTWVYLGTFYFEKGLNPESGKVVLSNGNSSADLSADAVKFGGGMGNVARRSSSQQHWKTSGVPRYMEGARYNLQYSGLPFEDVYSLQKNSNDYKDDYLSRGEWINYLMGESRGTNENLKGLNIPVDLALAFHTDAGITKNDSVIGTLAIFSTERDDGRFPSGQSKMVNRDFADIVQTQLVSDLSIMVKPDWIRRGLWDKQYSEAWRPKVPVILLELLSHQNLADMKRALDPRFQFIVSRAVYKAIVKFQAYQEHRDYVIQPLPVTHFSITSSGGKRIRLQWQPQIDSLENTAVAKSYMVYIREENGGFDNGRVVKETPFELELDKFNQLYSFKVTALNDGGESMPSEILSAGFVKNEAKPVLIVNGFDRICGPAVFDTPDLAGVAWWDDDGVAYHNNMNITGNQYDFNRQSKWLDDDSPGWGASYADQEGEIQTGNTFDNVIIHGSSVLASGHSFISMSDEAFEDLEDVNTYSVIDFIAGEEKTTSPLKEGDPNEFIIFTDKTKDQLSLLLNNGGNLFLSGAYIGTDLMLQPDSNAIRFARNILHYEWRTNHAVKNGFVHPADLKQNIFSEQGIAFNTQYHPDIYKVEAPDAIEPVGKNAVGILRYTENETTSCVLYDGSYKCIILGFPFETVVFQTDRDNMMKEILNHFTK